jgi:hypothetical protein
VVSEKSRIYLNELLWQLFEQILKSDAWAASSGKEPPSWGPEITASHSLRNAVQIDA